MAQRMSSPPDILWILTTQWRGQALGLAGDPNVRTPCLDAFGRSGLVYAKAYTPHPFGPFARAALLTGIRSPDNGVRTYFDPLPRSAKTIAKELSAAGYDTAFFGKWHLAPKRSDVPLVGPDHAKQWVAPEDRGGFAHWLGFEGGFQLNDPWLHGTGQETPTRHAGYQSDVLCEKVAQWINQQGPRPARRPWFCLLSLEAPHPPYGDPASGIIARQPEHIQLPSNVPAASEVREKAAKELAGYYSHIEATDRAIGKLLAEIPSNERITAFSSVHGDMHGAHGLFRKGWPYEESVRVPLIIHSSTEKPTGLLSGGVVEQPVSLLDLRRWTLSWALRGWEGLPQPEVSEVEISMPCVVPLPHQCDRSWRAVRDCSHKKIFNEDGSPWLCFDLDKDPLEMTNQWGAP